MTDELQQLKDAASTAKADAATADMTAVEAINEVREHKRLSPQEEAKRRRFDATRESWAALKLSPRRRRAARLAELDESVERLERRYQAIERELAETHERMLPARERYEEELAAWHRDGRGSRPVDPVSGLEERVRELQGDLAALERLISEGLEAKADFIERRRRGLVADARRAVEEASAEYREAIASLLKARAGLEEARRDEVYFRLYPDSAANAAPPGPPSLLIGKAAQEIVPHVMGELTPEQLRVLLQSDADTLPELVSPAQREALRKRGDLHAEGFNPYTQEAIWVESAEGQKALADDARRRREEYEAMWGQPPAW